MRNGKFTRIPERPADLAELWHEALPLSPQTLPRWASRNDADRYRYLSSVTATYPSSDEGETLAGELEQLKSVGLAIDTDEHDPSLHRIYVPGPAGSEVWSIGVLIGDSPLALTSSGTAQNPVLTSRDVTDVSASFVADPFMLKRDGVWFMFFEIMNWQLGRGQIGLAESVNGTDWAYQSVVLAEPFHLSYPYVFEWNGRCYMIPESHTAKSVRLYEAISFPTKWSYVTTLLEGPYFADPSAVRYQDTWWLFVDTSSGKKNNRLSLYYADDLAGPWIEHPRSPIVRGDPRIARPGGRVIVFDNRLIRYAQNCSPRYGSEVLAFEVTELMRTRYQERQIATGPVLAGSGVGWNAHGMHNIDPHQLEDGCWLACVDGWTLEHGWAGMTDTRSHIDLSLLLRDIEQIVPPGTSFVMVDKGEGLQASSGRRAVPFPERDGQWGGYPADDAAAIAELERLRRGGAEFMVFPTPMLYWLDAYAGLERHLSENARRVLENDRVSIFDLRV
jgi:hypothetical protein